MPKLGRFDRPGRYNVKHSVHSKNIRRYIKKFALKALCDAFFKQTVRKNVYFGMFDAKMQSEKKRGIICPKSVTKCFRVLES